jgi:pimeloyl-ACP methyl ester carboxylesterase
MEETGWLDRGDGLRLAWSLQEGRGPCVVFLPGFRSDMQGSKAVALRDYCAARGQAMLRLDYSGHGQSDGSFTDGTIGRWTEDAAAIIADRTDGKLVLVGSSMGGWIGLLLARQLGDRLAGYVGIAAAPDFTERLMWQSMSPQEQQTLISRGELRVPSAYGEDLVITRALIEDGRHHLVLDTPLALPCPVRLLQGQHDPDVPWETALALAAHIDSPDVQTVLIKDGDHRLSRPADVAVLIAALQPLLGEN